jgi:phosphatidylserine/phosphatidylglycerophosphate/cardiolipin synthase-like enzyme
LEKLLMGNPAVHLILTTAGTDDEENRPARQALAESGTDVINRMIPAGHIGHNKFMLYVDAGGTPRAVLSGSNNWTYIALCCQSNNALVVEDDQVAAAYFDYWNRLKADTQAAGADPSKLQSRTMRTADQTPRDVRQADGAAIRVWFSPNISAKQKTRTSKTPPDMQDVFDRIAAARQAILFLVYQPGEPSIIDAIAKAQAANPELFVRGAVTDPKAANEFKTQLYNLSGTQPDAEVIPPVAVKNQFADWLHELLKDPRGFAIIHDKIVVIDPFSADSVVIAGSHNLGYASSYNNDENLLIIGGKPALAQAYAAHVLDVYDHYRFRYEVEQKGQDAWSGLSSTPDWQQPFFQAGSDWRKLAAFWQAGIASIGAVVPTIPPSADGPAAPDSRSRPRRPNPGPAASRTEAKTRRPSRARG